MALKRGVIESRLKELDLVVAHSTTTVTCSRMHDRFRKRWVIERGRDLKPDVR
jgi:hypothetical protein